MLANILVVALLLAWGLVSLRYVLNMTRHAVKKRGPACIGCPGCGAGMERHCK